MLLICAAVLATISIAVSRRIVGSLANPMTAFSGTWLLAVSLFQSGLVELHPLLLREEILLGVGMASLLAGALIVSCARRTTGDEPVALAFPSWALIVLTACALGGFAFLVYSLSKKTTILVYFIAPEEVERLGFQRPGVGYLSLLNIVLPGFLAVQGRRARSHKWAWYSAAAVSLLTTPFAGIKSYFMQSALVLMVAILYDSGKAANRVLLRSVAIAIVLVLGSFVAYDIYFKDNTRDYVGVGMVNLPESLSPLARPIVYAAGPISTFGPFSRFHDEEYHGRATLRGAAKIVSRFEPTRIPEHNALFYSVPMNFNTYTLFRGPYEDGREAGIVLVPFCYGLLVQWVYFRMRAAPTVPLVVLAAYLTAAIILSPFAGFLVQPMAAYFFVVLLSLHFMVVRIRVNS